MSFLFALLLAAQPYHIDFTRLFASPEAEKADRAVIERDLDALGKLRGHVASHLDEALKLNDAIQERLARHDMYLYLRYAVNTEDQTARDEQQALDSEVSLRTAFLQDEILRMQNVPKIPGREFEIESIRRWREHTLSEDGEKLLADAAPAALQWQYDLYQRIIDNYGRNLDALAPERDLIAFILTRLASSRNTFAQLRHFHDDIEASYFRSFWTRSEVDSLLHHLEENADVYKRYQRIEKTSVTPPQFTIDEARRILVDATAPLGPDYTRELSALLDPANGRMDILPGPHRKSGGFSQGAIGTESVFYSAGFSGSYNDVRVLMHESTHALQRQLMNAAHVPVAYTSGPNFLAEGLAIFNELLLADYMAAHASDPAMRRFYLQQFLDGKGMIAFAVAPEAELEEAVYDGAAQNADDLDRVTKQIYSKFTIAPDPRRWMVVQLMYEDPFYDINYVFGGIVGLRLYAMYTRDPKAFAAKYIAMMRNGYTAPPNTLLRRFFGFDLNDPALIDPAVSMLNDRVSDFQRSTSASTRPPAETPTRAPLSPRPGEACQKETAAGSGIRFCTCWFTTKGTKGTKESRVLRLLRPLCGECSYGAVCALRGGAFFTYLSNQLMRSARMSSSVSRAA